MEKDPFKEYLRESEPDKAHKGYAWSTAIGLQAVDGLKPSKYLIDTAIQNIEGKIPVLLKFFLKQRFHFPHTSLPDTDCKHSSQINSRWFFCFQSSVFRINEKLHNENRPLA